MPAYMVRLPNSVDQLVNGVNGVVVFATDAAEAIEAAKLAGHANDVNTLWDQAVVTQIIAGTYNFSVFRIEIGDAPNIESYEYTAAVGDTVDDVGDGIAALINAGPRTVTYTTATQILDFLSAENLGQTTIKAIWDRFGGVRQIETITLEKDIVAGQTYEVIVNGVVLTEAFDTNNDTTVAAMAVQIAAEAGVVTAVVTDAGTSDWEIVVTSLIPGAPVSLRGRVFGGVGLSNAVNTNITAKDVLPIVGTIYANLQPAVEAEGGSAGVNREVTLVADATLVPNLEAKVGQR
jgi:hypothetical protein